MLVERFLSLLLSAAQRSKWGLLFIVVGSIWLFGMLMVGLVSTAGNVILVANGMKPVLQFLGSGLGILMTAIVSILLVFIGLGMLWFLRPQPAAETAQAEALKSGNPAPQRSGSGPTDAASPQADSQDIEQLRTKLSQAEQEIERLRTELNNRPPRHYDTPVVAIDSLTPNEDKELKEQLADAHREIEKQRDQLNRWDGGRHRFNELLMDAWSEGHELRKSEPTIEEVRMWQSRLETLLKRAVGDGHANRVLRAEPDFVSAIHDSTTEQRELESRLNRLDELRKNFQARDAIPFRPSFDPHEWEDWKSPPPTTEQAQIERLQASLHEATWQIDSLFGRIRELEAMSPEEYRARQQERRKQIEKWRAEIHGHTFARHPLGGSLFAHTETHSDMRPLLPPNVQQRYESLLPVGAILGSPRKMGKDGDRRVMLDEVSRIEKLWGLV